MTVETRKRLAAHFRAIGRPDHPHCLEFPDEIPTPEMKEKANILKNRKKFKQPMKDVNG